MLVRKHGSGKQRPHTHANACSAPHSVLARSAECTPSDRAAAHAGVAFCAALGLALVLVCMTLGQRACCPRPKRSRSVPLGGKPAPDIELGAKDPGLGPSAGPGTGPGEIGEAPALLPAPWPGGDPGKGAAQGNGAMSRAGSLQASRGASRQGSFSGRAWRSWRRMEELAGPAGGLEVTGLRDGRPVVLYDGPLGKVPARPHVLCSAVPRSLHDCRHLS